MQLPGIAHLRACAALTRRSLGNDLRKAVRARRPPGPLPSPVLADVGPLAERLAREGYVLIPGYMPAEECERWVARVDGALPPLPAPRGPAVGPVEPYTINRCSRAVPLAGGAVAEFRNVEDRRSEDRGVVCLYHIDSLFPELRALRTDPWVASIVQQAARLRLPSRAFKCFIHSSVEETQGFHVDNDGEPCFKAFVFLTDVNDCGDGAHSYVPGSHRFNLTKYRNFLRNACAGDRYVRGMDTVAPERGVNITCRAGTVLIVDVNGIHRALRQRPGRRRIVFVNAYDWHRYPIENDPAVPVGW